ncbi:MAG TPA: heliorhodopsin HeR [Bacillota bacterium]|nr:heliorhodopsin HeR [Bacillota bacterium]
MAKKATTTKKREAAAELPKKEVSKQPPVGASKEQTLRKWNLGVAAAFAAQAVAVAYIGSKLTEAITVRYLAVDQLTTETNSRQMVAGAMRHVVDVRASWIVAGILALFAIAYLFMATKGRKSYDASLASGINKFRWITLGLGGGAVFATLALLSGLNDVATLALIWFCVFAASVLGLAVELLGPNRSGLHRLLAVLGGTAALLPWLVLAKGAAAGALYGGHIPSQLWAIYSSMFVFWVAFVVATLFRWRKMGQWGNVLYSEKMYLLLILVMTSAFAWQVAAGVR